MLLLEGIVIVEVLAGLPTALIDPLAVILLYVYCENLLLALRASGSAFFRASRGASSGPSGTGGKGMLWTEGIGRRVLLGGVEKADGKSLGGGVVVRPEDGRGGVLLDGNTPGNKGFVVALLSGAGEDCCGPGSGKRPRAAIDEACAGVGGNGASGEAPASPIMGGRVGRKDDDERDLTSEGGLGPIEGRRPPTLEDSGTVVRLAGFP